MARVFLSYDHEDEERVAPIVAALQKAGHQVWWDRQIHGGAQYNSEIESAVANADAVVVLWSEQSVQSAWVRDEAAEGRDSGKLIPLTLDGARPPMGFRQFQTIDLSTAKGARKAAKLRELAAAVDKVMQIAARYGLLDYWRSSGNWPDFCLEPGLPYDCKKEAAKLQ